MTRTLSGFGMQALAFPLCLAAVTIQAQTTWYVDDDAAADPGPGTPMTSDPNEDGSFSHPFDAIQEAIEAAVSGDTVLVLDGVFSGFGNRDLNYLGKSLEVASIGGPNSCQIELEGLGRGFTFESDENTEAIVSGFTISSGSAPNGAGISCVNSSPIIENCIISDCVSWGSSVGGGIYCSFSDATIRNCIIRENVGAVGGRLSLSPLKLGSGADSDPV